MAIQLPVVNAAANDTFQSLIDRVNGIINTVANSVVTANTAANGATTTGNAFIIGTAGATVLVANTLRGGNVQSSANLTITSNALFTGSLVMLGANVIINTSAIALGANTVLGLSGPSYGNSTVNVVVNSTSVAISPNTLLTGTALSIGNSSVNVVVNTTGVSLSGIALPTTATRDGVAINGTLIGTASRINFSGSGSANVSATVDAGNSQINVIVNAIISFSNGAGGTNTNILFNDSAALAGSSAFIFDKSTNNVTLANTITIGTTIANSTIYFMGNSTINSIATSVGETLANSTVSSAYNIGGLNIGANVTANLSALMVGGTLVNSTAISTANVLFTTAIAGGNVTITTSTLTIGNSTVNTFANSTSLTMGSITINPTTINVGGNVVVNTTSFLFGNSTVSASGNSTQVQTANSTIAATLTPGGLAVGANVTIGYANVTVGTTIVNAAGISAAAYIGAGIATPAQYWTNTAGKLLTTDALNNAGAYVVLTDASSIVWDMSTGINFQVTLAGNRTLANPSNVVTGRSGVLRVIEDATGTRTLSFGANYIFDSDVAPAISTVANKENYLFWHAVAPTRILITLAAKGV